MFRKTSVVVAALASAATLALTASPAFAARIAPDGSGEDTTFTAEPTGTHTMSSENSPHMRYELPEDGPCLKAAQAANSWLEEAYTQYVDGGDWQQAQTNADNIAGEANKGGCDLSHPE